MMQSLSGRVTNWAKAHERLLVLGASLGAVVFVALFALPSQASTPWKWRDLSQQIPSTVQNSLTMVAGRGSDWLVSDGTRLWSVTSAEEVNTYHDRVDQYGKVLQMGSDGQSYLLAFRGASGASFVKTDLETWSSVSGLQFPQRTVRSIQGDGTTWAIMTDDQFDGGSLPKTWQLSLWQEGQSVTSIALPPEVSAFVPGCLKTPSNNSTVCASNVAFVPLNGAWYLFAGQAETRDQNGDALQQAKAGIWRLEGQSFVRVANAPSTRFISGVWAGNEQILFATSDAVTNPFAADTYWTFNGSSFVSYKDEPLEAGMLSLDTRSISAAWTGNAWAIVAGKTLIQIKNGAFAIEGDLRDNVTDIAGSTDTRGLLIGSRGTFETTNASTTPFLALLGEKLSVDDSSFLIEPRLGTMKRTELARITLTGSNQPAKIRSGERFTVRAQASADSGVKQLEILVNGAKVTSCFTTTCSYSQAYSNTNQDKRTVLFTARVTDQDDHVTESQALVLTIEDAPLADTDVHTSNDVGLMPAGLTWLADASSGISSTAWVVPSSTTATDRSGTQTVHVASMSTKGIERVEFWVNGALMRDCSGTVQNGIHFCEARIVRSDYPLAGDILVSTHIVAEDGASAWPTPVRLVK